MNRQQAEAFLLLNFPGKTINDAFLDMCKLFLTPLNDYIRANVRHNEYTVASVAVLGKGKTVSLENYPRNSVQDVALRACLVAIKYPNWTSQYIAGRRNLDGAPETGEPITIGIVLTIIVALAPVVLPFLLSLVQSFLASGEKQEELEQKAAQEKRNQDLKAKESRQKMLIVGGLGLLVLVGGIFIARRMV